MQEQKTANNTPSSQDQEGTIFNSTQIEDDLHAAQAKEPQPGVTVHESIARHSPQPFE
jgi:hypothetical protein